MLLCEKQIPAMQPDNIFTIFEKHCAMSFCTKKFVFGSLDPTETLTLNFRKSTSVRFGTF